MTSSHRSDARPQSTSGHMVRSTRAFRLSRRSKPSITARPSTRRWPSSAPRSRRSPASAASPTFVNTHRGAGAQRRDAEAGRRRVLQSLGRAYQRCHAGDRAGHGAGSRQAPQCDLHERGAVPPRRRNYTPNARSLGLTAEQVRVLDRYHTIFVRAGAKLEREAKKRGSRRSPSASRASARNSRRTSSRTRNPIALVLDGEADLAGLPAFLRESAARAADDAGLPGKHVITLSRSSIEPFLQFSQRRDLREQAFKAWAARGDNGGATDNKAIIAEMIALARRAGKASRLRDLRAISSSPTRWRRRPTRCWGFSTRSGRRRAAARDRERDDLQACAQARGREHRRSSHGTGATMPNRCAWRVTISTRRSSSPISSSTRSSRLRSTRRIACSAFSFEELHDFPRYHPGHPRLAR